MRVDTAQLEQERTRMEGYSPERLQATIDEIEGKLNTVFDEAGPELDLSRVAGLDGSTPDKVKQLSKMHVELTAARGLVQEHRERVELRDAIQARNTGGGPRGGQNGSGRLEPVPRPAGPAAPIDVGALFTQHEVFAGSGGFGQCWKQRMNMGVELDLDVRNTLFQTTAGWPPEVIRSGRVVPDAQRPVQVLDLFPMLSTAQSAYKYMEETTFTNAAAERSEAGDAAESTLALTEKDESIRSIATWIPVTEEQLDDVPGVQSYLNMRLPFMLRQRLDQQVLSGNGTAPNISGLLDRTGLGVIAKGSNTALDALRKAITNVRVTGRANPNAFVLHPNDWQEIQLAKTSDGIYLYGSPADMAVGRVWGLPVAEADSLTENTALCGDFTGYSALIARQGVTIDITDSHASYFIAMKYAVRARLRAGLAIFRPAAFCKVTGL